MFTYDWQGRRTGKVVWNWNSTTNGYEQVSSERFVYDGWNLIGQFEAISNQPSTLNQSFLWGSDISGSMDGAGGACPVRESGHRPVSSEQIRLSTRARVLCGPSLTG